MSFKYVVCNNCGKKTKKTTGEIKKNKSGKMYCSRSCAAKVNNRKYPKRKMEGLCKCGQPTHKYLTYCSNCYKINLIDDKTYGELKGVTKYQKNSRIRANARKKYFRSNLPKCCVLCKYSTHIDVCHIKDISSFSNNSLVKEINDLKNLIALCKNHHWEFDNNCLSEQNKNKINKYLCRDSNPESLFRREL